MHAGQAKAVSALVDLLFRNIIRFQTASCQTGILQYNAAFPADVAKLVDAPDLGSGAERCESSSLSVRTNIFIFFIMLYNAWCKCGANHIIGRFSFWRSSHPSTSDFFHQKRFLDTDIRAGKSGWGAYRSKKVRFFTVSISAHCCGLRYSLPILNLQSNNNLDDGLFAIHFFQSV